LPLRSKKAGSRDSGAIAVRTVSGARVMIAHPRNRMTFHYWQFNMHNLE
jgi:hypothetical protein